MIYKHYNKISKHENVVELGEASEIVSVRNKKYTQPMVLKRAPRSQGHFEITKNPIKIYLLDLFVLLV